VVVVVVVGYGSGAACDLLSHPLDELPLPAIFGS